MRISVFVAAKGAAADAAAGAAIGRRRTGTSRAAPMRGSHCVMIRLHIDRDSVRRVISTALFVTMPGTDGHCRGCCGPSLFVQHSVLAVVRKKSDKRQKPCGAAGGALLAVVGGGKTGWKNAGGGR